MLTQRSCRVKLSGLLSPFVVLDSPPAVSIPSSRFAAVAVRGVRSAQKGEAHLRR